MTRWLNRVRRLWTNTVLIFGKKNEQELKEQIEKCASVLSEKAKKEMIDYINQSLSEAYEEYNPDAEKKPEPITYEDVLASEVEEIEKQAAKKTEATQNPEAAESMDENAADISDEKENTESAETTGVEKIADAEEIEGTLEAEESAETEETVITETKEEKAAETEDGSETEERTETEETAEVKENFGNRRSHRYE